MTKKLQDLNPIKGGTRKISDLPDQIICTDKEHNPASHYCYQDGVYEHICPSCGKRQVFTVRNPKMGISNDFVYNDEDPNYIRNNEDGL